MLYGVICESNGPLLCKQSPSKNFSKRKRKRLEQRISEDLFLLIHQHLNSTLIGCSSQKIQFYREIDQLENAIQYWES